MKGKRIKHVQFELALQLSQCVLVAAPLAFACKVTKQAWNRMASSVAECWRCHRWLEVPLATAQLSLESNPVLKVLQQLQPKIAGARVAWQIRIVGEEDFSRVCWLCE